MSRASGGYEMSETVLPTLYRDRFACGRRQHPVLTLFPSADAGRTVCALGS
jgi:hypothetical protein